MYLSLHTLHTELLGQGHTTSSKFKTAAKYELQACPIDEDVYWLLRRYWKFIRPVLAQGVEPSPTDPLLINNKGGALKVGRRVSAYFERHGYDITLTTLRILAETSAMQAYQNGDITLKQRDAVTAISTHSKEVCYCYSYCCITSLNTYLII